jgi:hypothetical protein
VSASRIASAASNRALVQWTRLTISIYVPDDGYLAKVAEICKKYNVLLICDEIQTGLCRTGKMSVHLLLLYFLYTDIVGCATNGTTSSLIWSSLVKPCLVVVSIQTFNL